MARSCRNVMGRAGFLITLLFSYLRQTTTVGLTTFRQPLSFYALRTRGVLPEFSMLRV